MPQDPPWPFNRDYLLTTPEPFSWLAEDKGPIGQILQGVAKSIMFPYSGDELLRDAARREVEGDDPWEFLLSVHGIARQDAQIFRGAQSQRIGWRRLFDVAHGWGNLREKCVQLRGAPPNTPIQPCQRQLFSRMWRVQRWAMLDDPKLDKETHAELERIGKEDDRKLVKRNGRAALQRPMEKRTHRALDDDQLDYMLVRSWVRCGSGGPGLMFFSSRALTHYAHELHGRAGCWESRVAEVKKARQRLGLVLADEDNPYFTRVVFQHALSRIVGEGRQQFEYIGPVYAHGEKLFPRTRA